MDFEVYSVQAPGEPESFSSPTLNDDLSIRMDQIDGHAIGPIMASSVVDKVQRGGKWVEESWCKNTQLSCFVTESRFAFVTTKYDKGWRATGIGLIETPAAIAFNAVSKKIAERRSSGTALVGHVRYAWIDTIYFRNGSWGADAILGLDYVESPDTSKYLEFTLGKREDAVQLARTLQQRVVAYRLAETDSKDADDIRLLHEFLTAEPHATKKKGASYFDMPIGPFVAGHGDKYAPPAPPSQLKRA